MRATLKRFLPLTFVYAVAFVSPLALAQDPSTVAKSAGVWQAAGDGGAISAGGAAAVAAGKTVLEGGGNAADAAVATILAMTVTDSSMFCFGGEVPLLVYDARRGAVDVVCGQGVAPRLATREHFSSAAGIPGSGVEAAAVPAALDACLVVLDRYGTLTFAEAAEGTLALLAEHKVPWHADLERTLGRLIAAEKMAAGDRQRGLRLVADFFYRGPIAREIAAWSEANGGLIRYVDLATHVTRIEEPTAVEYRGHTVYKCGAWTQGPYVLETLRVLEGFDLRKAGHNSPQAIHLTLEAMKLGLADRDTYYADPLFADVPLSQLLSTEYATARRALIDPQRASLEHRPGDPRGGRALLGTSKTASGVGGPARDTTTCVVADRDGTFIAATPSGWSGVLVGNTGIWLGSRLQSFNTTPGHPNCIEPGKRPRITLTPTLVTRTGKPVLGISVAGGDGQDQTALQMLLNQVEFDLPPAKSVLAPRFGTQHHIGSFRQTPPKLGSLMISSAASSETVAALKKLGHEVEMLGHRPWSPSVLVIDPATGAMQVAGDPDAGRHAAAIDKSQIKAK